MADTNYPSVQYVVTNIPETISDEAVRRNIQKCFEVQVCEFVRLPDATAGLITFEDQRDASKVVQKKPSIQKQPLNFDAMCYESTSLCLQGQVIEMVGIQTLVQMAKDLFLACTVDSNRITVHGYWKTVELFRNEANSLFQSFAGQTFTRHTATNFQPSTVGTKSTVTVPKHFTSAYLPPTHSVTKTTASQNVISTITSSTTSASVTASVDRLFTNTKVTRAPTTTSAVTSSVSASSVPTKIGFGLDYPTTGKGKSLPGSVQVFPLELDLVRVTEVTSSPSVSTTMTASVTHASLSSAGIFLTTSLRTSTPTITTTTTSTTISPQSNTALTNQLETSHSDLLNSSGEVRSKIDSIQLPSGQIISLKQGDIIKEATDVIVNPANSFLKHEGGVAKAIDNASDGLVQLFSDELVARDGVVPVGGAKYTQAGGQLKCKYVVHTVGPDAKKHGQKECETLLKLSCENSLILADALKATSVSFPAISAGIYSVDVPTVARTIIKALVEYKYLPTTSIKYIQIVINDQGSFDAFKAYFAKKRKSLGKSKERRHTSSSARPKSTPMVADHTVTAATNVLPKTSVLTSYTSTTIPSYTFPSSRHHRTGSLDLDFMKKTRSGSTGLTHHYDQLT